MSVINEHIYGESGLKMIDLETMVKSLRLAWLKRIFKWTEALKTRLKPLGGLFFINCNYDVNDYTISSQFYRKLLLWWPQFRETFASQCKIQSIPFQCCLLVQHSLRSRPSILLYTWHPRYLRYFSSVDVKNKESKDYYSLHGMEKALPPNNIY